MTSVPQGFAKSLSKSDQKESQHCPTRLRSLALPRYPQRELLGPSVGGLVACPVTLFLATPAVESVVATLAVAVAQACKGEWVTGLPPQAAQSAAQLAPVCPQCALATWPHGASRADSLSSSKNGVPQDDSLNSKS